MADQVNEVLDGQLAYGTGPVTIAGTVYIVENETINGNATEATDRGVKGLPGRARTVKDRYSGQMVLQLAGPATPYPQFGDQFDWYVKAEKKNLRFYINKPVDQTRSNQPNEIETVTIEVMEAKGTVSTVA
jgi:hypothetical protein